MKKERKRNRRRAWIFFALALLLGLLFVLNLQLGSVKIAPDEVFGILLSGKGDPAALQIVLQIRLPRALLAAVLGGALALAGFLLQTFFHNPIAGPYILGISSGAKMAVAFTLIVFLDAGVAASSLSLVLAAFAGSLLCMGFVLFLSRKLQGMSVLLIGGIMIGYICSALTDILVTFADDAEIVNLHSWSQGSFSGSDWRDAGVAFAVVFIAFFFTMLLSKPMGAYRLGEAYAKSMGVDTKAFRAALILLSSLLSACVTAFAGPISFVGIAVPYLVKRLLGTSDPIAVIPASFLGGGVFCLFCDLLARTLLAPAELNISTVTSVFGAPVVIFMLFRKKGGDHDL